MLLVRQALKEHGPVNVVSPEELGEDAQVISVAIIGAPTVLIEKMPELQPYLAFRAMEEYTGKRATAVIPVEIGGINSLEPELPAAVVGVPVVDADGMGRAFPELQLITFFVYSLPCCPLTVADERGNAVIIPEALNPVWLERLARAACVQIGCIGGFATRPMSAEQVRDTAVPNTLSLARELGDAVKLARKAARGPCRRYPGHLPRKGHLPGKAGGRGPSDHGRMVPGQRLHRRTG